MSKSDGRLGGNSRRVFWILVFGLVVYLVVRNIGVFGNIFVALLGFGAVVLVHEFGHFIVAKVCGIRVEAFSIFMPPILLGVRRGGQGLKFRILPNLFGKGNKGADEGSAGAAAGKGGGAEGTEYRIGLIPFGGYVKLLGQDDTGPVRASDDPRSFANKPISIRIPVIAAGVTFNVISAAVIFIIVFLVGISLPPAVVGGVFADSPAARAGLKAGDEIIEVEGESKDLDFSNIMIAAALSDVNEAVQMRVRHEDGSEEELSLAAEQLPGGSMREFGILQPLSLTVAEVSDANELRERTGLVCGDRIKSVNGREVKTYWELAEVVSDIMLPEVTLVAERGKGKRASLIETRVRLDLMHTEGEVKSEADLAHIYSMVPRLRITAVAGSMGFSGGRTGSGLARVRNRISALFGSAGAGGGEVDPDLKLEVGDIIVGVGEVENPTYKELRDITEQSEGEELAVRVLRAEADGSERELTVSVEPYHSSGSERVIIGIAVALDAEHAIVAKTISAASGPGRLNIPRGAKITAVNGRAVSSFYDCIREIGRWSDQGVRIDYQLEDGVAGGVVLDVGADDDLVAVRSTLAESLPFKNLERLYRAGGPVEAIGMGYRRTWMFIAQTYVTLRRLVGGLISPKHLIGPVGIIAFSYRIVSEQPLVYYAYFLALISACIAVINFLPLPPFDGGLIVLMLVEKVRGTALSERTQGVIAYAGWVLVGTLFLYVTFNDIVRSFFS